jgi:carbonic anhydrase
MDIARKGMLMGLILLTACSTYTGKGSSTQPGISKRTEGSAPMRKKMDASEKDHKSHDASHNGKAVHWTYSGEEGPNHWGELSPDYAACDGKNQSPINLTGFIEADLKPIDFTYHAGGKEIVNNGHTVQINYKAGSRIVVDGTPFELKQFHFHAPSENEIDGQSYPMEAHLVHASKEGHLAVIGVMFVEGAENKTLAQAWSHVPEKADSHHALLVPVAAAGLLPAKREYYRFNGSLTTPPCSEGVRWLVMKEPITASKKQIEAFAHLMHHPNNRPIQPTYARPVLQ